MWILMGKVLLFCVLSSLLYTPSSCSASYGTTARSSISGQWTSRDSYISSSQKGYQSYDQRRDGRYGPPPLGPQLPEPLAQKIQPVGFHSNNAGADQAYLNRLSADRPSCARKRDYCLHDHDYPMDMVRSVIQRYRTDIYRMYQEMHPLPLEANGGNASYRYNFPNDRGAWACETDIFTMRIGWARNWAGRWKVVLNTDQFPQAVRLEHCKRFGTTFDKRKAFSNEHHNYLDHGVLLGYWFDERARTEEETRLLLEKYSKQELPFQKLDKYLNALSVPVKLTRNLDGFVHHADIIRLRWTDPDKKNVFYLAALPTTTSEDGTFDEPCLALATQDTRILARSAFHIFRNDNDTPNHIPLKYGERVTLSTIEETGHRMLNCELKDFNRFTRQSKHNEVTWVKELSGRSLWKVIGAKKRDRRRMEGKYIPVNTDVILCHLSSGQFLALEKETKIVTPFGDEKEVSGNIYMNIYKEEGEENKWQIEAPRIKDEEYGEPMILPHSKIM